VVFSLNTAICSVLMFAAQGFVSHAAHAKWSAGDAAPGMAGCTLETDMISLFDGYQDTRLRLSLANGALRVKTESNIDFGFNDVGLAVDGRAFIPADAMVDEKDVLFSTGIQGIIDQFIRGHSVTVYLRFWPTYPATQRYEARFSLMGFTRAYDNYKACSSKMPS
jgi:hypothetical protein